MTLHPTERARRQVEAELGRTSALLAEKTQELEMTLASVAQGVIKVDAQGHVRVFNQRVLELLALAPEQLQGAARVNDVIRFQRARGDFGTHLERVTGAGRAYLAQASTLQPGEPPVPLPEVYLRQTPSGRWLEVRTHVLEDGGYVRTFADVTEHITLQEALRENEARWRSLTHLSSDWYWEQDAEFRFVRFDGRGDHRLGMNDDDIFGKCRWELPHAGVSQAQWAAHRAQLAAHEVFHDFEMQRTHTNGTVQWVAISGEPMFDAQGCFCGYRGVARDITERKRAEGQIQRLAFYDELTGLPNRRLLMDRLERAVTQSARKGTHGALLFLDLDNFKGINDTLGHEWGDRLLTLVAQRITASVRASDTVARLGGDEFVLVLQGLQPEPTEAAGEAELVAQKVLQELSRPYTLEDAVLYSTPSIGITLFRNQEQSVHELLKRADLAMYQAKAQGRNTLCFFDPAMQAAASARSALEGDIRLGIERSEFLLHYQPVVNAAGHRMGVEALARWNHPQRGMVSPGEFIPLAEQTGLILPLGQQVLRMACTQLAQWSQQPDTCDWTVAVNVSAQEFRHPDFVKRVLDALRESGANAHQLKIELTESLLLQDVEDGIAKMRALRELGVGFVPLLGQGPESHVQHIVQRPHLQGHRLLKGIKIKTRSAIKTKGAAHKMGQDDGAEIAAAIRRQGLLAARVGSGNGFAVVQVVVGIDVV